MSYTFLGGNAQAALNKPFQSVPSSGAGGTSAGTGSGTPEETGDGSEELSGLAACSRTAATLGLTTPAGDIEKSDDPPTYRGTVGCKPSGHKVKVDVEQQEVESPAKDDLTLVVGPDGDFSRAGNVPLPAGKYMVRLTLVDVSGQTILLAETAFLVKEGE